MAIPSSTSIRLGDPLRAQATAYAERLGVSLNALIAFALNQYINTPTNEPPGFYNLTVPLSADLYRSFADEAKRQGLGAAAFARKLVEDSVAGVPAAPAPDRVPEKPKRAAPSRPAQELKPEVMPPSDVYAPCPCGSGKKWKFCHGKK